MSVTVNYGDQFIKDISQHWNIIAATVPYKKLVQPAELAIIILATAVHSYFTNIR